MKPTAWKVTWAAILAILGTLLTHGSAAADPIQLIFDLNAFRNNRGANEVGVGSGDVLQFGAEVIPNGAAGTFLTATQGSVVVRSRCAGFTVNPNFCAAGVFFDASLTGPWNLTFTNGQDQAVATTPSLSPAAAAGPAPFPMSVTVSGDPAAPTFTWSLPSGFTVNAVRLNLFDKNQKNPDGISDIIFSANLPGNATTFTMPATFGEPPRSLVLGTTYVISMHLIETRDGTPITGAPNANISRRSESFTEFTPRVGGGTTVDFRVPPGGTVVPIAGTYGANGQFTITDNPAGGGPARLQLSQGQTIDFAALTDLVITANAPGTLTLQFSHAFDPVPSAPPLPGYARSASIDGRFSSPKAGGALGGISFTAAANVDVINGIPGGGPNDVGPTVVVADADLDALGDFAPPRVEELSINCVAAQGALCIPILTGAVSVTFQNADDQLALRGSILVAGARTPGAAGADELRAALPPIQVSARGFNFPETELYHASFALDVSGPTSAPSGSVQYFYTRNRLNVISTSITALSVSGGTATVTGTASVNGATGHTFTAMATSGSPGAFGIEVRGPDGFVLFTSDSRPLAGGSVIITSP